MNKLVIENSNGKERAPLMRRILAPLIAVTILQAVIFYAFMSVSSIEKEMYKNVESLMVETSARRALYIETELARKKNGVSLIENAVQKSYTAIASKYALHVEEFLEGDKYTSDLLSDVSDDVISTLNSNSANGAFIVLCNSKDVPDDKVQANYKGVFFNDTESEFAAVDNTDIVMLKGDSAIAERYNTPLDLNWTDTFRYNSTDGNMDYFFMPVKTAYDNKENTNDEFGYWSHPFYMTDGGYHNDNLVIAYSKPIEVDNVIIGVVGITISVDDIAALLPSKEATGNESGCYALFSYELENGYINVDVVSETTNGFAQYVDSKVRFVSRDDSRIVGIKDINIGESQAICAYTNMDLYDDNSPYANDNWAIGVIDNEENIYVDFDGFRMRMAMALLIAIVVGTITVYFTVRYVAKPIKALAAKVRNISQNEVIGTVDTDISEIHDLSVMLNELSSKRIEYQNELITERERYLVALRSINENIIEYDCLTDVCNMYYFKGDNTNDIKQREYSNFRSLVENCVITHEDYIDAMLDFIDGKIGENGVYFRIKKSNGNGYIWTYAKSKCLYDNEGKLVRVIASSRDATAEKELEQKRIEQERLDPVTKFNTFEYGEILVSKFVMESNSDSAIPAILRIVDLDVILNRYGVAFFTAILEEVAAVIRRNLSENFVAYRGGLDEFVIVTPFTSKDEARAFFRKLIDEIGAIYKNENIKIESVVGAYLRNHTEPVATSRMKTRFASEGAYQFRKEYDGIVFADEITNREDFVQRFNKVGPHNYFPFGNRKLEEITDVVSFAFGIFERTDDINIALEVFLKKAGRMLGMDRILIFAANKADFSVYLEMQWNAEGMAPIEIDKLVAGKSEYLEFENKFKDIEYRFADTALYEGNTNPDYGKVSSGGTPYSVPMIDNDVFMGVIVYEQHEDKTDIKTTSLLCELTKIISAYISKANTIRESRAKSELIAKMSQDISMPMNNIIAVTADAKASEGISPKTMECLEKIDNSAHCMLSMMNDILAFTQINETQEMNDSDKDSEK